MTFFSQWFGGLNTDPHFGPPTIRDRKHFSISVQKLCSDLSIFCFIFASHTIKFFLFLNNMGQLSDIIMYLGSILAL